MVPLEISKAKGSCLETRKIRAFVDEIESFTPNFLPDDCKEFFRIDFFSVLPEYQGYNQRIA
jgi:hypothetical protein